VKRGRAATAAALLFTALAARAWAWGCAGHQTIAYLAWAHMTPRAQAAVTRILAGDPIARFGCREPAGAPWIVRVADWADAVRTPETGPWHYVDLPLDATRGHGALAKACKNDCVATALEQFERTPREPAALRYVIHLVADAHQPLHASDDGDEGGNCVRTVLPDGRRGELHLDWDTGMLTPLLRGGSPAEFARRLDKQFGRRYAGGSMSPADWLWQSHALAVQYAYGPLHLAHGCDRQPVRLSRAYVRQAQAVIERQLDRAGWRLARMLNADFAR
jgi:nuclease S1